MADAPFLSIDLGSRGGKLSFQTFDDLKDWAEGECARWDWIRPNGLDANIGNVLKTGQIYFRESLRSYLNKYPSNHGVLGNIQALFADHLMNGKALLSASGSGKFILKLLESDPQASLWALATLTGVTAGMNFSQVPLAGLDGFMKAMMFRHGLKGAASSEREALEALHGEMSTELSTRIAGLDDAKTQHEQLMSNLISAKEEFQSQGAGFVQENKSVFNAELEAIKGRFAAIEKTFTDKMALKAPVTYWSEKAEMHKARFKQLGWASLITMILSSALITGAVSRFVPKVPKGEFPDPWRIGLVLITVTMLIWVIRLLVKMTLSQLHLQTDAEERTVLANAYLALLQRDQALRPEDRELVLQVLFRSAATGIVDDGGPATPIEIITRAVSGGKNDK